MSEGSGEDLSLSQAPRAVSKDILNTFVDSPDTSDSLHTFLKHTSPKELVLQIAALTASEVKGEERKTKKELGEEEEDENLQLLVRALQKCFTCDAEILPSLIKDSQLHQILVKAADSPSALLRRLLSQQLCRLVLKGQEGFAVVHESGFYNLFFHLLDDPDVGVSSDASKALLSSLDSPEGVKAFFDPAFWGRIYTGTSLQTDSVLRIRVLSLLVEAGRKKESVFKEIQSRGGYENLMKTFLSADEDILLKITAISLIEQLGSYPLGLGFLAEKDIPTKLLSELQDPMLDETSRVSLVHVLADLAKHHQGEKSSEIAQSLLSIKNENSAEGQSGKKSVLLLDVLSDFLHEVPTSPQEKTEVTCAIGAWGSLAGSSVSNFQMIEECYPKILEEVTRSFSGETEIADLAMDSWKYVIERMPSPLPPPVEETLRKSVIKQALKTHLDRPFGESRAHSYPLLEALSKSRFAVQTFLSSDPLRRSLVDPFSDDNSDAKYAKHSFVKKILTDYSDLCSAVIDDGYLAHLRRFVDGGPFYMPPGAGTSVESTWA